MFGNKDDNKSETGAGGSHRSISGYIGKGMEVEGTINFEGAIRIEGLFKGDINSAGTLIVGDGGIVEANIKVDTIIVTGEVKGLIEAKTRVELNSPGKVYGEIRTPNLIICEGVTFEGTSNMIGTVPKAAETHKTYTPFKRSDQKTTDGGGEGGSKKID